MSQSWIFDFDGTLVDSAPSIKSCYEKITLSLAPERINHAKKILIGPTLEATVNDILGKDLTHLKIEFIKSFQNAYDKELIYQTKPYKNASNILEKLIDNGDEVAIATNKRHKPTMNLLNFFGWNNYFEWVACIDQYPQFKNKSEMVAFLVSENPKFKNSYLVGDTLSDGIAANENNLNFIKANFGYGGTQDWGKIDTYKTILDLNELI